MTIDPNTIKPGDRLTISVVAKRCKPHGDSDESHGWVADTAGNVCVEVLNGELKATTAWISPRDIVSHEAGCNAKLAARSALSDPTKAEALADIEELRRFFNVSTVRNAVGPNNADVSLDRLRTIQHYINSSTPMQTHHYAALEAACGGRINPETLRDLFDSRWDQTTWEVRAQYYEFMAGATRMFRPVGEE